MDVLSCDDWKDKKERALLNFLVNYSKETMFVELVNASSYSKAGEKLFTLLDKSAEKIGVENVA